MKKVINILILIMLALVVSAQTNKDACLWMKKGEWRNGFSKAKPHKSLNIEEFYSQYQKNTKQWNTLFQWLQDTDLENIPKYRFREYTKGQATHSQFNPDSQCGGL